MEQQTQGKLFILTGAIGLIISIYFLIGAFFPQDKSNDSSTEIGTVNSGQNMIEQGIESGEVDFTQILIEGQEKKNINILIPDFLFTSGFEDIGKEVKEKNGITVRFFISDNKDIYNNLDEEWTYEQEEMDIILLPTDILLSLTPQSKFIPIAEKITPYYHPSFSEIIDKETYTFIPHIIDPLVIYSHNNKGYPASVTDRLNIVIGRESPKRGHFPVLFGFSSQNNHFLKQGREIMEDNFFILYHIIAHLAQGPNAVESIKALLDIANLTKAESRNVADFINRSNKLTEENQMCKVYPSLCLFAYDYGDSRIGLLSDVSKIDRYFKISNYTINPFRYTDSYPARGRGFIAHKESISSRITMFLEAYIQASLVNINAGLRQRTIPASTLANSSINDPSIQGGLYENNNRNIYIGEKDSLNKKIQENKIIDLLEGTYTPELFIESRKQ